MLTAAGLLPPLTEHEQLIDDVRTLFQAELVDTVGARIVNALLTELARTAELRRTAAVFQADLRELLAARTSETGPLFELIDPSVQIIDSVDQGGGELGQGAGELDQEPASVGALGDRDRDLVEPVPELRDPCVQGVDGFGHDSASSSSVAPAPPIGPVTSPAGGTAGAPEGTAAPRHNPAGSCSGGSPAAEQAGGELAPVRWDAVRDTAYALSVMVDQQVRGNVDFLPPIRDMVRFLAEELEVAAPADGSTPTDDSHPVPSGPGDPAIGTDLPRVPLVLHFPVIGKLARLSDDQLDLVEGLVDLIFAAEVSA